MENYIVSARKYRPVTFESVVGQRALTTTLKNAILTGKLAHAYLFCGPRGVGKTTCARIFAKTINCLDLSPQGEACGRCESCRAFGEQRSYNIHELDAASNNSVDDIRTLVDQVRIPPQIGTYKVYIIDEVHMLSTAAFNAFLKTLEEPPRHAVFILATTEKHKILPTILSRCQIYDFNRITVDDMVSHLANIAQVEGIDAEPEGLNIIAQKADGGLRDALSIFDQVASFTGGHILYKNVIENLNVLDYEYYFTLTDYLLGGNVSGCLLLFDKVLKSGFDGNHFITGLSAHFRDLLVSKDPGTVMLLEVGASIRERYIAQSADCPVTFLYKAMQLANECDLAYKASRNKRLLVELALIRIAQLSGQDETHTSRKGIQAINKAADHSPRESKAGPAPAAVVSETEVPLSREQSRSQTAPRREAEPSVRQTPPNGSAIEMLLQRKTEKEIPVVNPSQLGVSIRNITKNMQESPRKEPVGEQQRTIQDDAVFNEKDLNHYWQEYAAVLPLEQRAFAARMKDSKVSLLDDTTFEMVVENDLIAKEMKPLVGNIQNFLRQRLHNSKITMTIRVTAQQEVRRAYGKVEKFQLMASKNPALLKLKEEFGLDFF